jgi:zinc transport system substrate-binding protein
MNGLQIVTCKMLISHFNLLSAFICTICGFFAADGLAAERIVVFAGIPPAAYLAERIGGDKVHVETLLQPGQDPHTFEPAPKQIQALGKARVILKTGMPFENQLLEKIRGGHLRLAVVDITEGIEKRRLGPAFPAERFSPHPSPLPTNLRSVPGEGTAGAGSKPGGLADNHSDEAYDPHVWLAPPLVKIEAANVAKALEKIEPASAGYFQANLARLDCELDDLDAKIRLKLRPYAGRWFLVFHPAFGYFADCYGLKQEAIQNEGKQPSPKQLRELILKAKADGVRVIFLQPQFDRHSADVIAEAIGGRIVPLNDMEKDIVANLQDIAEKIERSMK